MGQVKRTEWVSWLAVVVSLVAAAVFVVLTVLETQDKTIWAASPWRADPYHAVLCVTEFTVPVLGLMIALRLLVWRATGAADRARQMVRTAGVMVAMIALALGFEWAAVIGALSVRAGWQVGGLVVATVLTGTAVVRLARAGRPSTGHVEHDWLEDVVLVCRRVPALRRVACPPAAARVRRHAMTVFVVLSVVAAAGMTAGQAIGERWTDPLLIAWMLIAEMAVNLAFCVISNAIAGFIARPDRPRLRRIAETSLVTGCLAVLVAIAFHSQLWDVLGSGPLTPPGLAAITLGLGLATAVITVAVLLAHTTAATPTTRHDAASV